MYTKTQEKGAVTPQETDQNLPVSVQKSPAEAWVSSGLLQGWRHWVWQCVHGIFWGSSPFSHYLHHSLASGPTTGREHSTAHQQKIRLKIYWAWSHPSEQGPVFPTVNLSHQEASISLLHLSIRGQTEWKPQSQETNQTDHMDHSLVSLQAYYTWIRKFADYTSNRNFISYTV